MKKLTCALTFLAAAFALSACGTQNQARCQEKCAEVNALECLDDDFLDCEVQCPESWDQGGLDYADYIDCTYGQYTCDENGEYAFVSEACTLPS